MTALNAMACEACRSDAPQVTDEELKDLVKQIPDWTPIVVENVMQLQREFTFRNFKQAMAFSNQVGDLAEEVGHHPAILTEWGKVTVTWWTHAINGLHKNDFIMAAKTDEIIKAS